jgi:hypothetical protein
MDLFKSLKFAAMGLTFSCLSGTVMAQGTYAKLGVGYNFGMGSEIAFQGTSNTNYTGTGAPTEVTNFERVNISYGKGLVLGGTLGYMFNNNIGAELGISYLAGGENKLENSETNVNTSFSQTSVFTSNQVFTTRSRMVLFQPSLVISAGLSGLNPYTRFGLIVAKGSLRNENTITANNGQNIEEADKYFGGAGIGMQAALGLDFKLNDKLGFYSEIAFNNLTYSPEKGEVTKYVLNGVDQLPNLKPAQKDLVFEENYTDSSTSTPSASSPSSAPKQRFSLNSLGINLGVKFNL